MKRVSWNRRIAVAALLTCGVATRLCAQFPDFMPQRGIYPNGAYTFDKLESINKNNGLLTFTIPITSLPLGRAGMSVPVNLIYSSALFDTPSETSQNTITGQPQTLLTVGPSQWGGWSFGGYTYGLYVQAPSFVCPTGPTVPPTPYRLSVIMPDGAHHNLKLYGQNDDSTGSGSYEISPFDGSGSCGSRSASGPLYYFTTDGSYIKVRLSIPDDSWTISLPDGTTASGQGLAANGEVDASLIQDRNGNKVTIRPNATATGTVLTDDEGRTITITYNTVTQAGFQGAPLVWTLSGFTSQIVNVTACPSNFNDSNGAGCGEFVGGGPGQLQVPSDSGTLTYKFTYDPTYGYLNSVTLPSGATTTYTDSMSLGFPPLNGIGFVVTAKSVNWIDTSDGGSVQRSEPWSYSRGQCNAAANCTLTITKPDGGQHVTYFHFGAFAQDPLAGLVTKEVEPDGSTTEYLYWQNRPFESIAYDQANPYRYLTVESVAASGSPTLAAVEEAIVDKNGNVTQKYQFDWIPYSSLTFDSNNQLSGFSPGTILKSTSNVYSVVTSNADQGLIAEGIPDTGSAYWNPGSQNLRGLLIRSITSGPNTIGAIMEEDYDNGGGSASHGNPTQERHWDSTRAPSEPFCGLSPSPSAVNPCLNASNAAVTTRNYDPYGNLTSVQDPNGNSTCFNYTDPTLPPSLYANQQILACGSPVAHTFTYQWDLSTGLVTSKTDANTNNANIVTTYNYDPTGRQTQVIAASNLLPTQTNTTYDDANLRVIVQQDQNTPGDGALTTVTNYDQLYRVALTQQFENPVSIGSISTQGGIKTQTRYLQGSGASYKLVSNPYRAGTSSAAAGESTMGWTLSTFDQNGRIAMSQSIIGSGLPSPWGGNGATTGTMQTLYSGKSTTVIDQANRARITTLDGLGRTFNVVEDPISLDPNGFNYTTGYTYDALDNLVTINQNNGGLIRSFLYDSLKRLSCANNPEHSTPTAPPALQCSDGNFYPTSYSYDSNGNLLAKTDNRGLGVSYTYDPLNRVKTKSYFNITNTINFQRASYTYDDPAIAYSKGRLTAVATMASSLTPDTSSTNFLSFDPLGRVTSSSQTTAGNTFTFSNYSYNLAGSLTSITYPSGRTIATCYDSAGRTSQVGGPACLTGGLTPDGTYVQGAYASAFTYAAHGVPTQYELGNTVQWSSSFNSRLQMSGFSVANTATQTQLLSASLFWGAQNNAYPADPTNDNGNLMNATYTHGGPNYSTPLTFSETFGYDMTNRITSATDSGGWSRSFGYDAYGNMSPGGNPATPSLSFNGNNQISTETYDQAGDQQTANGNMIGYDFESHIATETDGITKAVTTYVYDGDGKRVEKYGPGGATIYVYDAMRQLAVEYSNIPNPSPCTTCYLSPNHLGTSRLTTDQNGLVTARHDYLPFGEEVQGGTFGRDNTWGPGADTVAQKFTGKERDSESQLDYFGARYYGSAIGRWLSPDPAGPNPNNPQTLNLYRYGLNNPLRYKDSGGLYDATVHHDLTQALAYAAGFSDAQADVIANSDQGIDGNFAMWTETNPWNGTGFLGISARKDWHFTTEDRRTYLWGQVASAADNSSEQVALGTLGEYLHPFQDSWAHAGFGPVFGHLFGGHSPDETSANPSKADTMADKTYEKLIDGTKLILHGQGSAAPPIAEILPFIQAFNRAKTKEEKQHQLTLLKGHVDEWRKNHGGDGDKKADPAPSPEATESDSHEGEGYIGPAFCPASEQNCP